MGKVPGLSLNQIYFFVQKFNTFPLPFIRIQLLQTSKYTTILQIAFECSQSHFSFVGSFHFFFSFTFQLQYNSVSFQTPFLSLSPVLLHISSPSQFIPSWLSSPLRTPLCSNRGQGSFCPLCFADPRGGGLLMCRSSINVWYPTATHVVVCGLFERFHQCV